MIQIKQDNNNKPIEAISLFNKGDSDICSPIVHFNGLNHSRKEYIMFTSVYSLPTSCKERYIILY